VKRMNGERGFITPVLAVILAAALLLGIAVSGLSDQMSLTSGYDWRVAQARSAADTGIERAKAKLLENPMWENGSEVAGPIDPNVPDAQVDSVDVKQESLTVNSDGSITRVVTVTSTGSSGGGPNKVSKTVQAKLAVNMPAPSGNKGGGSGGSGSGNNTTTTLNNNWDTGWLLALNEILSTTFNIPELSLDQLLGNTSLGYLYQIPEKKNKASLPSLSTATFGVPFSSVISVNSSSDAFYITGLLSNTAASSFTNQAIQSKNFEAALNALWSYSNAAFTAVIDNLLASDAVINAGLQGLLDPVTEALQFSDVMGAVVENSLAEMHSLLLQNDVSIAQVQNNLTNTLNTLNSQVNFTSTPSWDYSWNSYSYSSPSYNSWDYGWNSYSYSSPSYSSWDYGWNSYSYSSPSYSSWNYGWNSYSYSSWSWW